MNKEIKVALEGSIKKWERIVRSTQAIDYGDTNCPLCKLFFPIDKCGGCPVAEKSNNWACENTPHEDWANHQEKEHDSEYHRQPYCKECLRLAREELKFLESLRED